MMILLSVLFSLTAAFVGALAGSWFWTFHLGLRFVRHALADEATLAAFWLFVFKPSGGVGAMLPQESSGFADSLPESVVCAMVIRIESDSTVAMRRRCAFALLVCGTIFLGVSAYTSIIVLACFAVGVILSVRLRSQNIPMQSLATIFRAVRRWMDSDRRSLEEHGPHCLRGIVRVLDANEPVDRASPTVAA